MSSLAKANMETIHRECDANNTETQQSIDQVCYSYIK